MVDVSSPNRRGRPFVNTGTLPLTNVAHELTPFEYVVFLCPGARGLFGVL